MSSHNADSDHLDARTNPSASEQQQLFTTAPSTPMSPTMANDNLAPPNPGYFTAPSQRNSAATDSSANTTAYANATPASNSAPLLAENEKPPPGAFLPETTGFTEKERGRRRRKRRLVAVVALLVLAVIVVAVVVPVFFKVVKPKRNNVSSGTANSGSGGSTAGGAGDGNGDAGGGGVEGGSTLVETSGGDGSVIVMEDGTSFTYRNPFGGYWVQDPANPFSNNARANSWTPPLNTSWTWGVDRIKGVNLGGLFVLEPFITPALFQAYPGSVDEWTLSQLIAADPNGAGVLEKHYKEFITEQDLAEIAGAGLNWIRLPIPYWALEVWTAQTAPGPAEPFLARTCWPYILRVIGWARKYGIRVNLDLHTIPGSQNAYNHSGKLGQINFLIGPMGIANAERALGYIRTLAEFFAQPEYQEVVGIFGIVNEALVSAIGKPIITSFYNEAHDMIRSITGVGQGKGPYISIHDGFTGPGGWAGELAGSDRIMLDSHDYFAFSGSPNDEPIDTGVGASAGGTWPQQACERWAPGMNKSRSQFGVTAVGEWSNGFNDCGLFLKGAQTDQHNFPGSCALYQDASTWSDGLKAGIKQLSMAQMDAFGDWFFWTWKIGNSTSGHVEAPLWSYQLGLENGWMPQDPRDADGSCGRLGVANDPAFPGTFSSWQTGGAGAGTILATSSWPPPSISAGTPQQSSGVLQVAMLPTYTSTGDVITLPVQTFTFTTSAKGHLATETKTATDNGWFDNADTGRAAVTISGCAAANGYLDPWSAMGSPVPTTICGASATVAAAIATSLSSTSATSTITPPPRLRR